MKIILVDDNVKFRTELKKYIETNLGHTIIGEASSGSEFLSLHNTTFADNILMDVKMDEMDGIEATKQILWRNSYLKIIAITMYTDNMYLLQLIEAGFKGCINKYNIYNQLPVALEVVKKGRFYFPDDIRLDKIDIPKF